MLICWGCKAQHVFKLKPDWFDTSYSKGFLVSVNKERNTCLIKPIVRMEIHIYRNKPCSTVYKWQGVDTCSIGWYYHSSGDYDSSKKYGPCGYNGLYVAYGSEYKGDTTINYDCETGTYELFKTSYFIPTKNKKNGAGAGYELKENEYFGEEGEWIHEPFIFICI